MEKVEIKVKNCNKCPFATVDYDDRIAYYTCVAPVEIHDGKYDIKSYYPFYKKPKWCPLNNKELLITTK